ncbi:MAG: carboxymuconolactone decarboxylase family protein [Variovorax paradoxus]|nr:MAG: carboxymuconolactone decarboxylase family protein [Variovorax paradoxus]PZQ10564.1 MAG: carboxymuconolactone decarboxylase family protein [Variovorax paradoxus]
MARIPYFDLDQASPTIREMVASRPPLNIYRMVAHGGPSAEGFLALGNAILRRSELDPVLRELVILRVGALCGSHYEVFQHRRVAAQAGVPPEKIEAVLQRPDDSPPPAAFTALELQVLHYTDAVVRQVKAPAPLFDALAASLPHRQLVELTMTIGFYMLVCRLLENFEVDLEAGQPPASPGR